MKYKLLAIGVLACMLCAMVPTAATAAPTQKGSLYKFDVQGVDGTVRGAGSGILSVDTSTNTFVFKGRNCERYGTSSYDLYYYTTSSTDKAYLASGTPDGRGNLYISGPLPAGVTWANVQGATIGLTPPVYKAIIVVAIADKQPSYCMWELHPSSSTGDFVYTRWDVYKDGRYQYSGELEGQPLYYSFSRSSEELAAHTWSITLTVRDSNGRIDTSEPFVFTPY